MNVSIKYLSEKQNELISILYSSGELSQSKLSSLLGCSVESTSNIIRRVLEFEPPLIKKEPHGKYRYYSLTDFGKKSYEALINRGTVADDTEKVGIALQNSESVEFNDALKRVLITSILNGINSDNNDILVLSFKSLSIDVIMATFSMAEFFFLCFLLGMNMSPMYAASLLLPSAEIDVKAQFSKVTYRKFKDLIANELLNKREKEIFELDMHRNCNYLQP